MFLCIGLQVIKSKAQNLNYQPLFTDATFVKTIDQTRPVGVVDGRAEVSLTGAATYNLQLDVPKGSNDLKPQININYNSQSGEGNMGYGWNLNAISSITRGVRDPLHDGEIAPLAGSEGDAFYLDGQRLILTNGVYGMDGSEYTTEIEGYNKIVMYRPPVNSSYWFEVTTRTGTKIEYGKTSDSRVAGWGGGIPVSWYINKSIDNFGNYIKYNYHTNVYSGMTVTITELESIQYTGNVNNGTQPINKIVFSYKEKENFTKSYEIKKCYVNNNVIDEIFIYTNSTNLYKKYKFYYAKDDLNTYLNEIEEGAFDGTKLNTTIFKYGNKPIDKIEENPSISSLNSIGDEDIINISDLNADGKSEILLERVNTTQVNSQSYFWTKNQVSVSSFISSFNVYEKNNTGSFINIANLVPPANVIDYTNMYKVDSKNLFFRNDFNGDGKEDIITPQLSNAAPGFVTDNNTGITFVKKNFTSVKLNTLNVGNNFFTTDLLPPTNFNNILLGSAITFTSGDFDGDGITDILYMGYGDYQITNPYPPFNTTPIKEIRPFLYSSKYSFIPKPVKKFWYNNGSNSPTNPDVSDVIEISDRLNSIDIDGDGRQEIMLQKGTHSYIYKIINKTNGDLEFEYIDYFKDDLGWNDNDFKTSNNVLVGDFNGDRKTDFFYNKTISGVEKWYSACGTGAVGMGQCEIKTTLFPFTIDYRPAIQTFQSPNVIYPADDLYITDVNGDGKSDIFHAYTRQSIGNNRTIDIYYSTGSTFIKETTSISDYKIGLSSFSPFNVLSNPMMPADINGDGRTDFVYKSSIQNKPISILYIKPNGKEKMLQKILDGYGNLAEFEYKLLTEDINFYSKGAISNTTGLSTSIDFPINRMCVPFYAVSKYTIPNGNGGLNSTEYNYENLKIHRQGRGSFGFETITSKNQTSNKKIIIYNTIQLNGYFPFQNKIESYLLNTNSLVSEVVDDMEYINLSLNRWAIKKNSTCSKDFISNRFSKKTNNLFDAWYNIKETKNEIGVLPNNVVESETQFVDYINTNLFGCLVPSYPYNVLISKKRHTEPTVTHLTRYYYTNEGSIYKNISNYNEPTQVKETYTYNGFGNLKQKKIESIGVVTKIQDLEYDSYGRFMIQKTTNNTLTENIQYHNILGLPTEIIGADCKITKNNYDGFGNKISITTSFGTPLQKVCDVFYNWSNNNPTGTIYTIKNVEVGKPDNTTWFDKLGREVRNERIDFNGQIVFSTIEYNDRGNITKKTKPKLINEQPIYEFSTYDDFNRVIWRWSPGLATMQYDYNYSNGIEEIIEKNVNTNQIKKTYKDAAGRILRTFDHGGLLYFYYNSLGLNTKVLKQNAGQILTNTYDNVGRLIKTEDINSGIYLYEYDNFNRLKKQTNPNGNVQTIVYDYMGRIVSKTGSEGTVNYIYGGNGTSCQSQLLTGVTDFNLNSETYSYDIYNRLIETKKTIDGIDYITNLQYDNYSNLINKTYPSGIDVKNTYTNTGYLSTVEYSKPTTPSIYDLVYKTIETNGLGEVVKYQLGNGLTSINTYYKGTPINLAHQVFKI